MIRYALRCTEGHASEGWYRSAGDFDRLAASGRLACPVCGCAGVEKALMAPAVPAATRGRGAGEMPLPVAAPDPKAAAFREMLRSFHREVAAGSENVGPRFPEEARRMHYNEAERRSIRGEATPDEARALFEEGIEVMPLPPRPDEAN